MGTIQERMDTLDEGVGCDCQGACCKRINLKTRKVEQCSHLTDENMCDIYDDRPIACRIDEYNSPAMTALHCRVCKVSLQTDTPVPELLARFQSFETTFKIGSTGTHK